MDIWGRGHPAKGLDCHLANPVALGQSESFWRGDQGLCCGHPVSSAQLSSASSSASSTSSSSSWICNSHPPTHQSIPPIHPHASEEDSDQALQALHAHPDSDECILLSQVVSRILILALNPTAPGGFTTGSFPGYGVDAPVCAARVCCVGSAKGVCAF